MGDVVEVEKGVADKVKVHDNCSVWGAKEEYMSL